MAAANKPPPSMNIVLTGFMGTGKTSVGREVARRLGRPFVDMDDEIVARAGKPIPQIFQGEGEGAFRALEAEVCRELSERHGLVIATGGGALVDPENRRHMIASGPVFCLGCAPDGILGRLAGAQDRPLLEVADRRGEVTRLLGARQEAYAAIPRQIDTTHLTVEQVAARVIAEATSILLPVHYPGGQYPIYIGPGVLHQVGTLLLQAVPGARVAVVTNPVVSRWYLDPVLDALGAAGLEAVACTMPDGETYKRLDTLASLYTQFVAGELDRSGAVLALGGGVACDVAGLAAATYMRGLPVVQVPTTLLAMVDASVGGKTAVDLPEGKNLVGAFKQPAAVAIDPDVLDTLPPREVASGMAELIKHGVLADPALFTALEAGPPGAGDWYRWIACSLLVKVEVVQEDPYERGRRAVLNLGHTAGHAIEQLSGFELRHGEAVSIGMVAAAEMAVALELAEAELPARIAAALAAHDLPVHCPPLDSEAIWEMMGRDKKKQGRQLRWVLPRAIGRVEIVSDVPRATVLRVLRKLGAA
jgi:shikimate kinase/3-dehydroquinate synthase